MRRGSVLLYAASLGRKRPDGIIKWDWAASPSGELDGFSYLACPPGDADGGTASAVCARQHPQQRDGPTSQAGCRRRGRREGSPHYYSMVPVIIVPVHNRALRYAGQTRSRRRYCGCHGADDERLQLKAQGSSDGVRAALQSPLQVIQCQSPSCSSPPSTVPRMPSTAHSSSSAARASRVPALRTVSPMGARPHA